MQAGLLSNRDAINYYVPMVPDVDSGNLYDNLNNQNQLDVVKVLLHKFPVIDDNTPLETIIKFKERPESKLELAKLRKWMTEISKVDLQQKEINEIIESSLLEYSLSLRAQNLNFGLKVVQLLFALTQWTGLAGAFTSNHSIIEAIRAKQALTLSSLNTAGSELAFINSLNREFGNK